MTTEMRPPVEMSPIPSRLLRRATPTKLVALGMLLLQFVWVFAVPPFRGSDEFDHVYKAAAVARGDWLPEPSAATRNTGAWLEVPADIVAAARPQCQALPYTTDADCVGTQVDGIATVASGAGRYNPVYYAIVGTPALPFSGIAALYVMRIATVLLSWSLFVGALWVTQRWARNRWPTSCLVLAATPVAVYSSSVVAPNGVEIMSALAFWTALVGLAHGMPSGRLGAVTALTTVSGCLLVTLRSLGPLWCLLAVTTILASGLVRRHRWRDLLTARVVWAGASIVVTATLFSTWWIVAMDSTNLGARPNIQYSLAERAQILGEAIPLWLLQSIAAFPLRNESTLPAVYVCYLVLFAGVFVAALSASRGLLRLGLLLAVILSLLVPWAIGVATYNSYPEVWQGRYGLPYSVGIAVLAGVALNGRDLGPSRRVRIPVLGLFVVAHALSPLFVAYRQGNEPVTSQSPWPIPPMWILAILAIGAAGTLWWKASRRVTGE